MDILQTSTSSIARHTPSSRAARALCEFINLHIIKILARRRTGEGRGFGDRAAPSIARAPVELRVVEDRKYVGSDQYERQIFEGKRITKPGEQTATRKAPQYLSRMLDTDPRKRAAEALAVAHESLNAVAGSSFSGGGSGGGDGVNDGGIANRIRHAHVISVFKSVTAGVRARSASTKESSSGRAISGAHLVHEVCVEGRSFEYVLKGAGWSGQRRDVAHLGKMLGLMLELASLELWRARPTHLRSV